MSQKIYFPNTSEKPPRHSTTATTPRAYTSGNPAVTTQPMPATNATKHNTSNPPLLILSSCLHQARYEASLLQKVSLAQNAYLAQLAGQTDLVLPSVLKAESSQALFQNQQPIRRTHLHRRTHRDKRSSCYLA